jgi:hypothetical protein
MFECRGARAPHGEKRIVARHSDVDPGLSNAYAGTLTTTP